MNFQNPRLHALVEKALANRAALAAVFAMAIKAGGSLLTLLVFTLAARAMSGEDFGELAIWFNALNFLAIAAVFGQDTLITRSFGEYAGKGEYDLAWGAYRYGWRMTGIAIIVTVILMALIIPHWFESLSRSGLIAGILFLITQTSLHYSSHSTRAAVGFAVSETGRELIWRIVLLAVVTVAVMGPGFSPAGFFLASAVGQIIAVGYQLFYMRLKYRQHPVIALREDYRDEWAPRARSMWFSAMIEGGSLYFDVMLIGYLASSAVAGEYFVAARIASIFLMVLTGLNTYSYSHSANLYFSGQIQRLQEILRALVGVSAVLIAPCLLLIYVFGANILTIFGERYAHVYPTLSVLATACFVMCLSGSASVILLTTGHEKLYSRIIFVAMILRITLSGGLAAYFGSIGAAWGWAIVNAPLYVLLSYICWRACGVDTSILGLLHRHRPRAAAPDIVSPEAKGA